MRTRTISLTIVLASLTMLHDCLSLDKHSEAKKAVIHSGNHINLYFQHREDVGE